MKNRILNGFLALVVLLGITTHSAIAAPPPPTVPTPSATSLPPCITQYEGNTVKCVKGSCTTSCCPSGVSKSLNAVCECAPKDSGGSFPVPTPTKNPY